MDDFLRSIPDVAKALIALLLAGGWILKLAPLLQALVAARNAVQQTVLVQRREERAELVAVVKALKTQIEVLMDDNTRLRGELSAARTEIEALSRKLDYLEYLVARLPRIAREQCPRWKEGESCPVFDALEDGQR